MIRVRILQKSTVGYLPYIVAKTRWHFNEIIAASLYLAEMVVVLNATNSELQKLLPADLNIYGEFVRLVEPMTFELGGHVEGIIEGIRLSKNSIEGMSHDEILAESIFYLAKFLDILGGGGGGGGGERTFAPVYEPQRLAA